MSADLTQFIMWMIVTILLIGIGIWILIVSWREHMAEQAKICPKCHISMKSPYNRCYFCIGTVEDV